MTQWTNHPWLFRIQLKRFKLSFSNKNCQNSFNISCDTYQRILFQFLSFFFIFWILGGNFTFWFSYLNNIILSIQFMTVCVFIIKSKLNRFGSTRRYLLSLSDGVLSYYHRINYSIYNIYILLLFYYYSNYLFCGIMNDAIFIFIIFLSLRCLVLNY